MNYKTLLFPRLLNRRWWILRLIIAIIVTLFVVFQIDSFFLDSETRQSPLHSEIIEWAVILLHLSYITIYINLPRIRHGNMPTAFIFLSLIPIANMVFILIMLRTGEDEWDLKEQADNN